MKKSLFTITTLAIATFASAQITITQADFAPLYTQVRVANDTMPTVTAGSPGASQTYNLAGLANHRTDTLTFTLPQFTNANYPHTSSNRAIQQGFANIYGTLDASGFYMNEVEADPLATGTNINLINSPAETNLTFPSTFNTAFNNNFVTSTTFFYGQDPGIGIVLDSIRLVSTVTKSSVVDGWGNVTTPAGTYPCVRQNVKRANIDSIYGYNLFLLGGWAFLISQQDSNRVYTYWANAAGYPVAEVTDAQDLGTITSGSYLLTTALIGITENSTSSTISSFPNPANESINFSTAGTSVSSIEIYDVTGNVISTEQVSNTNTIVNVANYASGIYFYRAINSNGNVVSRGKFTVAH